MSHDSSTPLSAQLSAKEEALAALAASIAAGCRPCTSHWIDEARTRGACERGVRLAIETGLSVRRSATSEMTQFADSLQAGPPSLDEEFRSQRARLIDVMACAAAFAVRSSTDLQHCIDLGRKRGASADQLGAALAMARGVRAGADKEVDKIVRQAGLDVRVKLAGPSCCEVPASSAPGCGCAGGRT
jgi:alkylhydroperoxidase family enzyme